MKRKIVSVYALVFWTVVVLLFSLMSSLCFLYDVACILDKELFGPGFLWCGILGGCAGCSAVALNRFASVLEFENTCVKRKGLFCGFEKECLKSEIVMVEPKYVWREGMFLFLIDKTSTNGRKSYDRWSKESYIGIKKKKKNEEFINE